MDLKCEKCDGKYDAIKYCRDCMKAFCHKVKTIKMVNTSPKMYDVKTNCPDCGSENVSPITSESAKLG